MGFRRPTQQNQITTTAHAMPKFHVRNTFEIPDRSLFVMAGSIVDGEVRTGMFYAFPCSPPTAYSLMFTPLMFALHQGQDDVCLFPARTECDGNSARPENRRPYHLARLSPTLQVSATTFPPSSLAHIPDRAEFPHAATTARSGPSSRSPSLRAVRPGDAFTQLSTINSQPVPRQPADSLVAG